MAAGTYKAYLFKTKDPAIDKFRTVVEDHFGHRVTRKDLKVIEESGGPKVGTTANWFFGDVLRPQNPTLEAAGQALGYERVWRKKRSNGSRR